MPFYLSYSPSVIFLLLSLSKKTREKKFETSPPFGIFGENFNFMLQKWHEIIIIKLTLSLKFRETSQRKNQHDGMSKNHGCNQKA